MTKSKKGPLGEWVWSKYLERISERYLSQADFARELDLDPVVLNHYINGRRLPTDENIEKLAKLGFEIYDLLGLRRPDPDLDRLINAYDSATPSQREEIISQALRIIGFVRE